MASNNPIRLSSEDLFTPKVEGYLEEQASLRRDMPQAEQAPLILRILYSSYFYMSVAGGIGALVGWGLLEGHLHEDSLPHEKNVWAWLLLFPTVSGFIGLFLGAAEGVMSRNLPRALLSALVGLAMGFVGGAITLIPAGMVYRFALEISENVGKPHPGEMPRGMALLIVMMGRGVCWAIAAIPAGIGQGVALRQKKIAVNGLLGGVLGGLLGGLLFDPIYLLLTPHDAGGLPHDAGTSRGVGFAIIGIMVGLLVGLVEQWTKTAWVLMKAGPLSGKQFVIYRNPTVIGSAPKADIYIFKDPDIEPKHALLHNRGGRFEIEDCGTKDGTYVNGVPITKQLLKAGDQIVIGKTMFEFSLKETD